MISLLVTLAPIILKLFGLIYTDKEERAKARVRFLKYIEQHEKFTNKPVETRARFKALRKQAEEIQRQEVKARTRGK